MVTSRRTRLGLLLVVLITGACSQSAVIVELRAFPSLLCPCDPLRAEVVYETTRRIDVALEPPGTTQTVITDPRDALGVAAFLFAEVCAPAIFSATAFPEDPEPAPATAAINVSVLLGPELIPASAAPVCGASCTIAGYAPIGFSALRFSETIQVLEVCNRSGRRVEVTSPDARIAELPLAGCSTFFAGARLVGPWGVRAQPRITPSVREVCPDPACVTGETGPRPGVEAGVPLDLEFLVGCPPD
jgi:hypothetical protein